MLTDSNPLEHRAFIAHSNNFRVLFDVIPDPAGLVAIINWASFIADNRYVFNPIGFWFRH
jgi:hypothetical protein